MRRVLASTLAAVFLSTSAVAVAAPATSDAWVKTAQQRLDKVLGEPVGFSSPGTRIGEVRMRVDAKGNLSGFEIIQSTGSPQNDEVVMEAARDMSPLPPPPASVMGHPVVVRVSFITPTSIEERYGLPELKPYVYVEETPLSVPKPK